MFQLDDKFLADIGLNDLPEEQKKAFLQHIYDELELRVGTKLSDGMSDEQLEEIAKFPKGVAVVYQNDWLEPVLCQINKFRGKEQAYVHVQTTEPVLDRMAFNWHALNLLLAKRIRYPEEVDLDLLLRGLRVLPLRAAVKAEMHEAIAQKQRGQALSLWQPDRFAHVAQLITNLLECRTGVQQLVNTCRDYESLHLNLQSLLGNQITNPGGDLLLATQQCLMKDYSLQHERNLEIYSMWRAHHEKGVLQ